MLSSWFMHLQRRINMHLHVYANEEEDNVKLSISLHILNSEITLTTLFRQLIYSSQNFVATIWKKHIELCKNVVNSSPSDLVLENGLLFCDLLHTHKPLIVLISN